MGRLLLRQILRRLSVGATLHKFSGAGQFASRHHSQVINLLTDKNAEFRENQPRVIILRGDRK